MNYNKFGHVETSFSPYNNLEQPLNFQSDNNIDFGIDHHLNLISDPIIRQQLQISENDDEGFILNLDSSLFGLKNKEKDLQTMINTNQNTLPHQEYSICLPKQNNDIDCFFNVNETEGTFEHPNSLNYYVSQQNYDKVSENKNEERKSNQIQKKSSASKSITKGDAKKYIFKKFKKSELKTLQQRKLMLEQDMDRTQMHAKLMYSKLPEDIKPSSFKQKMIGVALKQIVLWLQVNASNENFLLDLKNAIPELPQDFISQVNDIKAVDSQKEIKYIKGDLGILLQKVVYRGTAQHMLEFIENTCMRKLFLIAFSQVLINSVYPQKIIEHTKNEDILLTQQDYQKRLLDILILCSLVDSENLEINQYMQQVQSKLQELQNCKDIKSFAESVKKQIHANIKQKSKHLMQRAIDNAEKTRQEKMMKKNQ